VHDRRNSGPKPVVVTGVGRGGAAGCYETAALAPMGSVGNTSDRLGADAASESRRLLDVCADSKPDPVAEVLRRLGARRRAVARALEGEAMVARIVVVGHRHETTHVAAFLPDGTVGRLRPDGALAPRARPQVTVRGSAAEILGLVVGEVDLRRALAEGLLVLHEAPAEIGPCLGRLLRMVGEEVGAMAGEGR
jgi:hypothetical protein